MSAAEANEATGRPEALFPLFAETESLPGVGRKTGALFAKVAGPRLVDLLFHLPVRLIDRRYRPRIAEAELGRLATMRVTIERHVSAPSAKLPHRIIVRDETGFLTLVYFHAHGERIVRQWPEGSEKWVSGTLEEFHGARQIVHPDFVVSEDEFARMSLLEPVYPLTAGLTNNAHVKAVRAALERVPNLPEWQDETWLAHQAWPPFKPALMAVHAPDDLSDLDRRSPARQRLAYDELLASQLALALVRRDMHAARGRSLAGDGTIRRRIIGALPYSLTGSQSRAVEEILADLASPQRMVRLLQGDVGSGKTIVALLAMAAAVEAGTQAALMAPTEILVRQHMETMAPVAAAAGLRTALLTGRDKGRPREDLLARLAGGDIDILFGTHALIEEDVRFKDLGLVVVDEQHRFGVHQRLALASKGHQPTDFLVMTATPIPRTLTLAAYGDMEVSRLTEKPPGRQPVKTVLVSEGRMEEVVAHLRKAIAGGARAYWVCPLVDESEAVDLAAAQERHDELAGLFPGLTGLVHGRLKAAEKDRAMAAFASGAIRLLVATTVIEVGVNVPEATIMVIEHAERFGLAQLHQLRGRVGRGSGASTCLLLYRPPLGETAEARLKILRETEDGFRIAEEDLRLRGAGDVLGSRQSGLADFRLADLDVHGDLLAAARDDAKLILARKDGLSGARGASLRMLLHLFGRDDAARLLKAG